VSINATACSAPVFLHELQFRRGGELLATDGQRLDRDGARIRERAA